MFTEFFEAVARFDFMRHALLTGVLVGVASGIVGTYVVTRRITYIAGGIAHAVLGGMGIAFYFSTVYKLSYLHPYYGAVVAALAAALTIGFVSLRAKQREDTIIGAIWAIGMAVGVLFISQTPGYGENLMSYLFGNILLVSANDLYLIGALDVVILLIVIAFYNQLQVVCFDEEFARIRGINVEFYYLLLLCLVALTVVLLVTVVGVVMVIALLTLPAAIAGFFSRTLKKNMVLAVGLSIAFTTFGLAVSYSPNLPAGATIIIVAGIVYLLVMLSKGGLFTRGS